MNDALEELALQLKDEADYARLESLPTISLSVTKVASWRALVAIALDARCLTGENE